MPTLIYLPEVCAVTKQGKKYIFEVLDSQGKNNNLIIADIIQSYLVENVSWVFFIAKNRDEEETTIRLSKIIGKCLERGGYKKNSLPDVSVYRIEKKINNKNRLHVVLKKYAKDEGWG